MGMIGRRKFSFKKADKTLKIRILVIKTSSMGDIIHLLPAIQELMQQYQQRYPEGSLEIDWLVEPGFSDIPEMVPEIRKVYTIPIRAWRKQFWKKHVRTEFRALQSALESEEYAFIVDAQGLMKTAWIAFFLNADMYGFDKYSVREYVAASVYEQTYRVEVKQHAILRLRQLLGGIFKYEPDLSDVAQNIYRLPRLPVPEVLSGFSFDAPEIFSYVFVHATTWKTKRWPLVHWRALAERFARIGESILIPWGTEEERLDALTIAKGISNAYVPESRQGILALIQIFQNAKGVYAVDTGLAHLAALCDVPMYVLYGASSVELTGVLVGIRKEDMLTATGVEGNEGVDLQYAQRGKIKIFQKGLKCQPCLKKRCKIDRQSEFSPCMVGLSGSSSEIFPSLP